MNSVRVSQVKLDSKNFNFVNRLNNLFALTYLIQVW